MAKAKGATAPIWWQLKRQACADAAISGHEMEPQFRLWLLALGRATQGGHAQFAPGELRKLLARPDKATGEFQAPSQRTVRRWVTGLADAGLISPESRVDCVALAWPLVDSNVRVSPVPCPVHGNNLSWSAEGWFDPRATADELAEGAKRSASAYGQQRTSTTL